MGYLAAEFCPRPGKPLASHPAVTGKGLEEYYLQVSRGQGTTMTGQRAWRASQPGTDPATWCHRCRGAPITSASALSSAAALESSRAGLPCRMITWTSTP